MKPTIEQPLEDIKRTLNHAKLCHEAWWFFVEKRPDRSRILGVYNNYLSFFETVRPALYTSFVVKLASVFDENRESISLKTLKNEIQKSTNKSFKTRRVSFDQLWDRGRRLYKYRNKVIAHRDKEVPRRNFARETGFTFKNLKEILIDACKFIDEAVAFLGLPGLAQVWTMPDIERLIEDLSDAQQ